MPCFFSLLRRIKFNRLLHLFLHDIQMPQVCELSVFRDTIHLFRPLWWVQWCQIHRISYWTRMFLSHILIFIFLAHILFFSAKIFPSLFLQFLRKGNPIALLEMKHNLKVYSGFVAILQSTAQLVRHDYQNDQKRPI